jgi:hypothetical protein
MTTSYRILRNNGVLRIECSGQIFAEDELREAIWLVSMELRYGGLPRRERIAAKREIAEYGAHLAALRSAGA